MYNTNHCFSCKFNYKVNIFGLLAQLVERFDGIEEVAGSNPVQSTSSEKSNFVGHFGRLGRPNHTEFDFSELVDDNGHSSNAFSGRRRRR